MNKLLIISLFSLISCGKNYVGTINLPPMEPELDSNTIALDSQDMTECDYCNLNSNNENPTINDDTADSIFLYSSGLNLTAGNKWDKQFKYLEESGSFNNENVDSEKEDVSSESNEIFHSSTYLNTLSGKKWDEELKVANEAWKNKDIVAEY